MSKIDITSDENYLDDRFQLFFKYTVPSVISQTWKDFLWYVFFSDRTPDKYKNITMELREKHQNIFAVYLSENESCTEFLLEEFKNLEKQLILTSRIDNDDAFAKDYMKAVHERAKTYQNKNNVVLVIENGLQYDEKYKILSNYHFPLNHFTTMMSGEV